MGTSIASLLVLSLLFTAVFTMFNTSWAGTVLIGKAMSDVAESEHDRARTSLDITSANYLGVLGCDTGGDLTLQNNWEVPVENFEQTEFVVWYTPETGVPVTQRLTYSPIGLADGEWSLFGITPDNGRPWLDPGETASLGWRFPISQQPGSPAYLTVVAPNGVAASDYGELADASLVDCYFLHNDPTPPIGDTVAHPVLPMSTELPFPVPLFNYDTDRDSNPGLTLARSQDGLSESVPEKFQVWQTSSILSPLSIAGDVLVYLRAALSPPNLDELGVIVLYLRDYDGFVYTEIGEGAIFARDWQQGSSDLATAYTLIDDINYTVPVGHKLELRVLVDLTSEQDMRFGYDTRDFISLVNLFYVPPVGDTLLYFHNNPTPPTDDTARQAVLPLSTTVPSAENIFRYGTPNNNPGLLLKGTELGLAETNPSKYQVWQTAILSSPLPIVGDVTIDIWSGIRQFQQNESGAMTLYLRDYDGASYTEIASGSVFGENWQGGSDSFVEKTILIFDVDYTVPENHQLEVRLVADTIKASKNMWFAYDTVSYPSVISIP